MNKYIRELPSEPTFKLKGLKGYRYPIVNENVQITYIDSIQGNDNFAINKTCTLIYYVLEGKGYFEIDGEKIYAEPNILIEVPPNVEYCYTGKMKLLEIMNPPFFIEDVEVIKVNPNVK